MHNLEGLPRTDCGALESVGSWWDNIRPIPGNHRARVEELVMFNDGRPEFEVGRGFVDKGTKIIVQISAI
jgi:hypothetical protein